MADYTYATSSGKTYDDFIKESEARALAQSAEYTKRANAANTLYKNGVNDIYDKRIKAEEERAAAETKTTYDSFNAQFDANAASQLARERHLKEQMANYGLENSGYTATNQTALAVSRGNADAATRAARAKAVDAIAQDLREYRADAQLARAKALAESDRDTADRVLDTEQELLLGAHDAAMDRLDHDSALQEFTYERERDEKNRAEALKSYVDEHNGAVYEKMLAAYNSGNTALAEEFAKSLWKINEEGTVVSMTFDTTGASQFVKEQTAFEKQLELKRAAGDGAGGDTGGKTGYDELGFPRKYGSYIQEAREAALKSAQTKDYEVQVSSRNQALSLMYLIEQRTKTKGSEGYMDQQTFRKLLRYVGITQSVYDEYVRTINHTHSVPTEDDQEGTVQNPASAQNKGTQFLPW